MEEMYGEPFDVPAPEDTVFIGWFAGGEVFRSGLTFRRGYGRIFYFQPGHEEYPIYYDETIRLILRNSADWAASTERRSDFDCPNNQIPLENI
jgi:trehalose utilization protein